MNVLLEILSGDTVQIIAAVSDPAQEAYQQIVNNLYCETIKALGLGERKVPSLIAQEFIRRATLEGLDFGKFQFSKAYIFDEPIFNAIVEHHTIVIPDRVNLICNRLLHCNVESLPQDVNMGYLVRSHLSVPIFANDLDSELKKINLSLTVLVERGADLKSRGLKLDLALLDMLKQEVGKGLSR